MSREFFEALAKECGGKYISPEDTHSNPVEKQTFPPKSYPFEKANVKMGVNAISAPPVPTAPLSHHNATVPAVPMNVPPMSLSNCESICWTVQRAKWIWRKVNKVDTHMSKLSGSDAFSENYTKFFNKNEYMDVTDPNSDAESIYLFACLCDIKATQKFYADKYYDPIELRENFKTVCKFYMNDFGTLTWETQYGSPQAGSWLEMIQTVLNISWIDAVATLAKMIGLDFENMTGLTSNQYAAEINGRTNLQIDIPTLLSQTFIPGKYTFTLENPIPIKGHSGQVISAIAPYRFGDKTIYVPCSAAEGKLSIGKHKPTAHFLNQDLLDKYPGIPVLFFDNLKVALEFNKLLGKLGNESPEIIITAHLGRNLGLFQWGYLYLHSIIFVPDGTKVSLAWVKCYAQFCKDRRIESFSVAKIFVALGEKGKLSEEVAAEFSDAEKHILDNCLWLDEAEYPQTLLRKLLKSTQTFDEFESLWKHLGVFKDKQQDLETSKCVQLSPLPTGLKPSRPESLSEVTALHVIRFGATIMLVGMKNAGKTQVSYCLASAVLGKKNIPWPFCKNDFPNMGNVCIVDGETPYDEIEENLVQHGLMAEFGKRLFLFSAKGGKNPDWFEENTINDEVFREEFTEFIIQNNCRLLILDNMKSLMGSKIGQPDAVQKIMDWIHKLQKKEICVAYLLHKDEDAPATSKDKNKGSATFRELARVIINVIGSEEIEVSGKYPDEVLDIIKRDPDSLTCGIGFPTCKTALQLERLIIWLHLPQGTEKWQIICVSDTDGKRIILPEIIEPCEPTTFVSVSREVSDEGEVIDVECFERSSVPQDAELSEKARLVYATMKNLPEHEWTIGELEEKFKSVRGMGRDTIRKKYLAELIAAQWAERLGDEPRRVRYKIIKN